jgi:hypothetical protein
MSSLPKGVCRNTNGNGYRARCSVDGKLEEGTTRATVEEAVADHAAMKVCQKAAAIERRKATAAARVAEREEHAAHINASQETYGDNLAKDGFARALLRRALEGHGEVGVVDGVEYSIDQHAYFKADDLGFDSELDVELDDVVPTLGIELKLSTSLQPSNGSMDNPHIAFKNIRYAGERATIVLMIYVPDCFDVNDTSSEKLDRVLERFSGAKFWYQFATKQGFAKCGEYTPSLHGGHDASTRGVPLSSLASTIAKELRRNRDGLRPYGERKRKFKSEDHRLGQCAIDAFEDQVLRPVGARFVPPADGCEGGPEDRGIVFADASRKSAQIKKVRLNDGLAGFHANMSRRDKSIRRRDGSMKKLTRPYAVNDGVDLFIYVALDDEENVGTYWAATTDDLLGGGSLDRLITDESACGVTCLYVHPKIDDKARLGDTVENGHQDSMAVRTRAWVDALGPVLPPTQAAELKRTADIDRRALRLSAKASRAAAAAARAEAAASAGPSQVTNNINNTDNSVHLHLHIPHQVPQLNVPPGKRRMTQSLLSFGGPR